jgi:hypothetical protein
MNKPITIIIANTMLCFGCARTWVNYPPEVVTGKDGVTRSVASRAFELNGSDALGATNIEVTRNGVRFASAGGIDNSTSTREGYRTVRYGVSTAGTAAGAYFALAAYQANQAANAASNVAASKAAAATAVSSKALPAAGSTINATVPATVVPLP